MNEHDTPSKSANRENIRHKKRYGPRLHGKRLAEILRNALTKRIRKT